MKLSSLIASRPVFIFILLVIVVLLLPSLIIPCWYHMTKNMKDNVDLNLHQFHSGLLSEILKTAEVLNPISSSASNLARVISSSMNESEVSSTFDIDNKMAPSLFQAFSTIPHISQISYIGLEGPFFSYYIDGNQTFAMYSNSTTAATKFSNPNGPEQYSWYKQLVAPDSGRLYGDAIETDPFTIANASWIKKALYSTNGLASLGRGWSTDQDLLVRNTVNIHRKGVISLGFSVKALMSFFNGINLHGGSMYLATQHGDILMGGLPNTRMVVAEKSVSFHWLKPNGDQINHVGDVSCMPNNSVLASSLNIGEKKYMVYCSQLEIVGVQSVSVLAFPCDGSMSKIHWTSRIALILLIIMLAVVFIFILSFVVLMVRATIREMHLCAALIRQKEATQQAERKSMNKSLAFATASHDIRAALAGITGLIELSHEEVTPGSEVSVNLQQMDGCTKDLVGLLNSVLDTSKIEAGKMQLEEEEFDIAHLLEDAVDLYHPVAMKKGVDLVLDPYDGSILKFSQVKGDRGKLKQVVCNLLSNAVKFTSNGHISVRAWAQKPRLESKIIASNQNSLWRRFSSIFYKNREEFSHLETMNSAKQNPNAIEFVFEVDDTGVGIPKEKQRSIFENFVQVKETALGQGGTGLGLGIVQSLVRLMGGEIGIVDKEHGEKGTCFRFNVFFATSETSTDNKNSDVEMGDDRYLGLTIRTPNSSLNVCTSSPRLSMFSPTPRNEGSIVVLLIKNEERQRTTQKFMEGLGIKVMVVSQYEYLYSTLMKIKSKQNVSPYNFSGKSDSGSKSDSSNAKIKDIPLSDMDGTDQILPAPRSGVNRGVSGFVLLLLDASAGPFQELCKIVSEFKSGHGDDCCKVVWLDIPASRGINLENLKENVLDPNDDVLMKPFHGSRLYRVIRLLPEFRGTLSDGVSAKPKKEKAPPASKVSEDSCLLSAEYFRSKTKSTYEHSPQQTEIEAEFSSWNDDKKKKLLLSDSFQVSVLSKSDYTPTEKQQLKLKKIKEKDGDLSNDKPLRGMKFLVAEDNALLRKLAMTNLLRLGATVELCVNGQEALELVRIALENQRKHGHTFMLPYDYILMDCEMPVMNGYEATRQIRMTEKDYGTHIPIIALTAHVSGGDAEKTAEAGMDVHLGKPLKKEELLEAIRYIHSR